MWITGASSGIGEALTYALYSRGASLIISSNNPDQLERVRDNCKTGEGSVRLAPFDLADTSGICSLVDTIIEETGDIDLLFNIGGLSQRSEIAETPIELDRRIMEINYFGTIALTKAILPHMIRRGSGHIIATSSISGRFGFPLRSAYSASKHALHGFFETMRIEMSKKKVDVSILIPGRVRTNISYNALVSSGEVHGKMDPGLDRGITPEKAAEIILKGVEKKRFEIPVGGNELIMLYIRKYLPWLFFRLAGRISAV